MPSTQKFDTYTQVGKKEDVADAISNIAPTNTPVLTAIGTSKVNNILYQWQEDSLDPPAVNAQVEGANATAANMVPTVMRNNTTQILEKTVSVTGSTDAMSTYGRNKEFAYQMMKKSKEIKRDLEYALVGTRQSLVTGSSTVPRKFAGMQAQIDSSMVITMPADGGGVTTGTLNEGVILDASERCYNLGGDPDVLMVKPHDPRIIAAFAASVGRTRYLEQDTKKLTNVVDVYEGPHGQLKVVMNRWQATVDAFVTNFDNWKLAVYRAWQTEELAKIGDSRQSMLLGEYGLKHMNYLDSVLITNLT